MAYFADNPWATPGKANFWDDAADIWGRDYYDNANNGSVGYSRFLQDLSPGDNPFSRYMQGRFNAIRGDYSATQASQPELRWTDYLQQHAGQYAQEFNGQSAAQRGTPNQRLPRLRWLN